MWLKRFGCLALIVAFGPLAAADDDLQTVAERSDYRATARLDDVVALGANLTAQSRLVRVTELGRSGEDRPIPLWIVADPPVNSPEEAARSGKLVVLLLGNIHGGEVCGKEALPMLVRDLVATPGHPILKDLILAVVPIYNVDGNERVSKNNRPGQVGPEEGMGTRGNAKGLDLNRDFVKLDAPETRALVRFLNRWNPHVFIDTHTTNGSHHRYTITYQGPQNPAGDRGLRDFVHSSLLPEIDSKFEHETGRNAFFYGNFEDNHSKWATFPATPRFGTNYVGLRNRIAILSEAYAYAPYQDRVQATRDFVRDCLEVTARHKDEIARRLASPGPISKVAIRTEARPFPEPVDVLGFVEEKQGGRSVATTEEKDYRAALVQDYAPTLEVTPPFAYLFPPRYSAAVAALRRHGLKVEELRETVELPIERFQDVRIERSGRVVEGHHPLRFEGEFRPETRPVEAGSIVVRTGQPLGNLAVYLLEPQSDDGLATWNAFDDSPDASPTFPVLRLTNPAPLLTAPSRPLPEDQEKGKPITFALLQGGGRGRRGGFDGAPVGARWLDEKYLLMSKNGRLEKVEATTGRSEPFYDPEALARGLADLPTIGREAARTLARRPPSGGGPFGGGWTMDPDRKGGLFDYENDLYYATLDGKDASRLTSTPGREELAEFSPDGRFVAFVRDNDLRVVDLQTRTERALTTGGSETIRNGKADWVYFEEIFNRNWKAFWWSPDSSRIVFLQCDDTPVGPHAVLVDVEARRRVELTPYPKAGEPNPKVRLGIVEVAGGPAQWADLSSYLDGTFLISQVGWWPGGKETFAYVQDRAQTWLDVCSIDARSGAVRRLLRDTTGAWVESPGAPHVLDDGSFLLLSERDGWKHLYLFARDGDLKRQVTRGNWEVRSVESIDEKEGFVYFTATRDNPVALNLYRVKFDGGEPERLTKADGSHTVSVSPDGKHYVDRWSDLATPTRVALFENDGDQVRMIDNNPVHELEEYRFGPRERFQIRTKDGFMLEAELISPPDLDESKSYPVWFTTYGGPHAPTVTDSWSGGRIWEQALAHEGFLVFRVDPRSASGKGAVSAWPAYKRLGIQELADITEAIEWLKKSKPYVDGSRIGISGHSYGGFMTAFALTHSDLFAAGIAGAPVTDWHDYDSIYTERYMLTPQENPEGYAATSVVGAAGKLHGRLLILHGMMDDNVSLRNSMRLVHALQQADKDFELMIYPPARHGIFGPHYQRLQVDFIRRTLGGPRDRPGPEPAGAAGR